MNEETLSMITILNKKEFQIFKEKNKMQVSFMNVLFHPSLLYVLKQYMEKNFGKNIKPIFGLSCLNGHFVKLKDLNTDLGADIFDYLSVGVGDVLVELEMKIYNVVSIEISKLFELNRFIDKIGYCSTLVQESFRNSLFIGSSIQYDNTYSFLPNITFASCKGCLRVNESWEKDYILDLKNKKNIVDLLYVF